MSDTRVEEAYGRLGELEERSNERGYIARKMSIEVTSQYVDESEQPVETTGSLFLSVSENPEDGWVEFPVEAQTRSESIAKGMQDVLYSLNLVPLEYGDLIFEEGFLDILEELNLIESEEVSEEE